MDEYRTPLEAGGKQFGTLVYGVAQPGLWTYMSSAASHAPLAILGPACCMVVGAVLLNRMVRPVADIEQQLSRVAMSASVEGCELLPVAGVGAAAMGWNRVVNQRAAGSHATELGQQIQQSLAKGRQGRLDGVLNSIPDGVATTDAAGQLTYTNLPMAAILGMNDIVGATDANYSRGSAPKMTDLLDRKLAALAERRAALGRQQGSAGRHRAFPRCRTASAASFASPAIRSASSAASTTNATSGSSATSRSKNWPRRCATRSSTPPPTSCARRWRTSRPTPRRSPWPT